MLRWFVDGIRWHVAVFLICNVFAASSATDARFLSDKSGPGAWRFFPLNVNSGQQGVDCGAGVVVEWFISMGDYVKKGDPIGEICPGPGKSITCSAPATGQVVAKQPLGPEDNILKSVGDSTVAVIQPSGHVRGLLAFPDGGARYDRRLGMDCTPVKCKGVTFEQFLMHTGDLVRKGDVVALALTTEGMIDHCRAPADGHINLVDAKISPGQAINPKMAVACIKNAGAKMAAALASQHKAANVGHQECPSAPHSQIPQDQTTPKPEQSLTRPNEVPKQIPEIEHAAPSGGKTKDQKDATDVNSHNKSLLVPQREQISVRRRLPLADMEQQVASDKQLAPASKQQAPTLARPSGLACLLGALIGLTVLSVLGLGTFVLLGKTQTRSLYMLMQDSRDEMSKGLRIDFRDGTGCEKSFFFESQPLGVVFSKQPPFRVDHFEFNSCAKEKGIQLGWTLTKVGSTEVRSDASAEDVERMLQLSTKSLAFWPLRVDFDTGNGAIKAFYFVKQPLGVELTRQAPFKIALFKPDSYAKTCGVELGWVIVRVGDAVVNQRTNYSVLNMYFDSGLAHLPQEPKGLRIDFNDPGTGKERVFYFQRRSLGMVLTKYKPIRVQSFEFNSYAKERGVQAGWTITRIGDQTIPTNLSFEQVDRRIAEGTASLEAWPLRLDFDTGKGIRTFYFEKQPLGMELLNKLPIKVDTFKPDSYAKSCGVQLGWIITRVGDHDVTPETKFDQVIEYLVEGVCELPPVDMHQALPRSALAMQRGPRSST